MKSCRAFDDSHVTDVDVLLKSDRIPCTNSEVLDSLWIQNSSPSFHGTTASMVNFEQARGERNNNNNNRQQSDCRAENCDDDDEFDGCFHHSPAKKRRLTAEQVQYLEKSFDVENKLEPDRKNQLAKELGLQPRQVAIWFQNRRARSKTKVLEKEYDSLKSCYDKLKADYENLFSDNEKLRNEVNMLSQKLLVKENDPISPLDFATKDGSSSPDNASNAGAACKPEEASSYSSHVVESDFSQDEDDQCHLVQRLCLPKLEAQYYDDLQPNSCNLGFPVQNQGTWFWQC